MKAFPSRMSMLAGSALALALVSYPLTSLAAERPAKMNPAERSFQERNTQNDPNQQFDQFQPHIGLLGGASEVPGEKVGGLAGIDLGMQVMAPFSVGVNFAVAGALQDQSRTSLLGKLAYNVGGTVPVIRYSFIGANLGLVRDSVEIAGTDDSVTNSYFGVGPVVGFDQPIHRFWTVGAEAKYLANFVDFVPNSFAAMAAVKYWM